LRNRHLADLCLFDTKTSAMNRHENFPERHSQPLKQMRFNGWFTPGTRKRRATAGAHIIG
jgi:hypothetical protein